MRVFIVGAGKVGRALARAIRATGWPLTLHPARRGVPKRRITAELLILAVRDRELSPLAEQLAASGVVSRRTACVHVAGALGPESLASLRKVSAGVAQMHPMISFASLKNSPSLRRGNVHVQGDPLAVRRARALAKRLGMSPRTIAGLDTVGYHAAAGLVANGAAALAALGAELLIRSGVARDVAPKMLGPLVRSVGDNVESLGFPEALTGPVRRGDAVAVEKHLRLIEDRAPAAALLYLAAVQAQLPLARAISDAPPSAFDRIEALVLQSLRGDS